MSDVPTKHCPGCGDQPVWDFYVSKKNLGGLSLYCKTCTKRRNAISQTLRRETRRALGLPAKEAFKKSEHRHDNYLDRHLQRREQEALNCLSEPSPEEMRGVCFGEQANNWVGVMDSFLRQRHRVSRWQIS